MFMLYRLRDLGMTARVFESGTNVGGTWYWNRYPGARFDSESWTYGYSFSKELMQEWDWKEHFSPQPDTLEYLNHVADKFDFRRDMQFNSTVSAAHWDSALASSAPGRPRSGRSLRSRNRQSSLPSSSAGRTGRRRCTMPRSASRRWNR
jgi:phytoene dehydrogenase-like protein